MNKELIRIERKILRYCLRKIKRDDLADNLDLFNDTEIHQMYVEITRRFKEE